MIKLGKLSLEIECDKGVLSCPIEIGEIKNIIWIDINAQWAKDLCYERSDAFIVGVLGYALKYNHDIYFTTPISEQLMYQLTTVVIDALSKSVPGFSKIKLYGPIATSPLQSKGGVATGISCGIDSFHAIANHFNSEMPSYKLTHLTFFNVGSHGFGTKAIKLYSQRLERARKFSKEYGLPLVECNSNLHDVLKMEHLYYHTYLSSFAILCLQKIFSKYYYASSDVLADFHLNTIDPAFYEAMLLNMFSTENMDIYSEGPNSTRLDKTFKVGDFTPSFKYLNVCIPQNNNCGRCEKCIRTLLSLDAAGKLENFSEVFDLNYYKKNNSFYLSYLYSNFFLNREYYTEIYPFLKDKITIKIKLYGLYLLLKEKIVNFIILLTTKKQRTAIKKIFKINDKKNSL